MSYKYFFPTADVPCETNREKGKRVSDCLPGRLFEELGQMLQHSDTLKKRNRPCFQSREQMCEENNPPQCE